jgi:hypothetical protein
MLSLALLTGSAGCGAQVPRAPGASDPSVTFGNPSTSTGTSRSSAGSPTIGSPTIDPPTIDPPTIGPSTIGPSTIGPSSTGADPNHPADQVRPSGQRSRFTRLSGRVAAGTEPGCLLLKADDGKTYLLIGGRPAVLRAGQRVEVVGARDDTSVSTCQEGIGFLVTADRQT